MTFPRQFERFSKQNRVRAFFCLIAVLLLQSPVLAAVAIASGLCCSGDYCPVAAHHQRAAKTEDMPMDCDHNMDHGARKIHSCSMSCCDTAERSAVHSSVFLVSPVVQLAYFNPPAEAVSALDAGKASVYSAPLSPPPKLTATLD